MMLCYLTPLYGQWEELPELSTEEVQDNWLQRFYGEMRDSGSRLAANSRIHISDDELSTLAAVQYGDSLLYLQGNLYLKSNAQALGNFQCALQNPKHPTSRLAIGSQDVQWGLGTILSRASGGKHWHFSGKPSHPAYASINGVLGSIGLESWQAFGLAASQKRPASLQEEKIRHLYRSRYSGFAEVREDILGGGIGYSPQPFSGGVMAYIQSYAREFSDPDMSRVLPAYSVFAGYDGSAQALLAEAALLGKYPAVKLEARSTHPKLEQLIAFSYHKGDQLPAYASRPGILSSEAKRHELRYDVSLRPYSTIGIGFAHAMSRRNSSFTSRSWLQRSILSVSWKGSVHKASLQLSLLDRELLQETDSTYLHTLPKHYRVMLKLDQSISQDLSWRMQWRYHYQEKLQSRNNSFYWCNELLWKQPIFNISAGVKTFQSLRTLVIPDEEQLLSEGYSLGGNEDNLIYLKTTIKLARIRIFTEFEQSWLNARRTLYLGIGT